MANWVREKYRQQRVLSLIQEGRTHPIPEDKAKAPLIGADGNAFNIMGITTRAMRKAGYSKELIDQYMEEIQKVHDYDSMLVITMDYVEPVEDTDNVPDEEIDMDIEEKYGQPHEDWYAELDPE